MGTGSRAPIQFGLKVDFPEQAASDVIGPHHLGASPRANLPPPQLIPSLDSRTQAALC